MRRLLLIVVCLLPFALSLASANGSSVRVHGKIVYSSDRGENVGTAEIYSIRADGWRRRDLTRNQGHDGDFAWSPTGNRIAFWANRRGGIRGLYVMRADGSRQQLLTPSDMQVSQSSEPPTWSPDGQRLAFSAYRSGVYGIWVVRADGDDLRLLASGSSWALPVWAPRGSRIALAGDGGIELVDADSGGRLHVTDGNVVSSPTWSPDARALAFVLLDPSTGSSTTLYRVSAEGGSPQPLVYSEHLADPAWSPQGTTIVFTEGRRQGPRGIAAIKTVDADGGVAKSLGLGAKPVWSPDGRRIASATYSEIRVMNADGSGRRKVRDEAPARLTAGPAWSRDGKTLLFASVRDSADHELFVVNADGSRRRRLTSNNAEDVLPSWSPDHTRIAFARKAPGRDSSIWVMSSNGTNQHRLGLGTSPSWSPQGSRLAFERRGVVYTMTDRGRSVRRIVKGEQPVWAPRGTRIAFLRDTELFVAHADGAAVRQLADLRCEYLGEGDGTLLSSPEWSPRARQLVVSVTCDHGRTYDVSVALIDARGAVIGEVPIDLAPGYRVAWSPDGARLAYSLGLEGYGDAPRIATALLDGGSMRTLTRGAGDDRDPDW